MSYSTNPVLDAARHYEPLYREADESAAAEAAMREDFLALALAGDLNAAATFARPVLDHRNRNAYGIPMRPAKLFDVLEDAIDYEDFTRCLFAVLLKAAKVDGDARELLERMASKWASMNSEAV